MSRGAGAVFAVICGGLAGALVGAFIWFAASAEIDPSVATDLHSTWPESAEFSQLMTGQERFSEHATNVDGLTVVVDHETGVQYLADGHGMTALLDVDGSPLRVMEASDDGE